ncbi:MAG: hypothetical protein JXR25_00520 [Pontiellaceae bacterium]|nr:hypothetical protein [Pontiellaceae bacterium]MBN2783281.1 hypothetical protein [Pontiellaceae bacterium]
MKNGYVGIDVQLQRPCAFAIVNESGALIESGWFSTVEEGQEKLRLFAEDFSLHIGIDAPRCPILHPRAWYWDGSRQSWRGRRSADKGLGRHCEVAVKALGLANPQWTPMAGNAPDWMELGFMLFNALNGIGKTYEAFPSAAYSVLQDDPSVSLTLHFSQMKPGPKDMLDAFMAAATVREFVEGRGSEVGGGDGLGTIILPRPVRDMASAVLAWPDPGFHDALQ